MLGLVLRDEFKGERLKGTTIDFSADKDTSALKKPAEFLSITYPSVDLLQILDATQPGKSRPVVLLGGRGQGKSHHWSPHISLCLQTTHGTNQFALGRRKWRITDGYPMLAHGGLSLLEVVVPFVEIGRPD